MAPIVTRRERASIHHQKEWAYSHSMRIARFTLHDRPTYGVLEDGSERLVVLDGDPLFGGTKPTGQIAALDEVRLLSPVIPRSKVIGVADNYRPAGQRQDPASHPTCFFKPNTSVIGPDTPVVVPPWADEVHIEAELAVVIKTLAKNVSAAEAETVILGYTVANDISARDPHTAVGPHAAAKGFDTACPLGPWLVVGSDLDLTNLTVRARVDGQVWQEGTTADMVHKIPELIEYLTGCMTLLPGDVILTGTPVGQAVARPGQRVEVEVAGVGSLANPVVQR